MDSNVSVDIIIPEARTVNYTDADAICGYARALVRCYNLAGGSGSSSLIQRVRHQGTLGLNAIRYVIDGIIGRYADPALTLSDIPALLRAYETLYRIVNEASDSDYIRSVRLQLVDLWLKGDKSISKTDMVLGILYEAARDNRTLQRRYSQYAFSIVSDWIRELRLRGTFPNTPFNEAYARLSYLLTDDLSAYFAPREQAAAKNRWIETHTLADGQIDRLPPRDLHAYLDFTRAALTLRSYQ